MSACAKPNHSGGEDCATCAEHQVYKRATERRKQNGIRLKRWCVMLDSNQIVSANDFFSGWIETFGKQKAGDYLLVCLRKGDEALRHAMSERAKKK